MKKFCTILLFAGRAQMVIMNSFPPKKILKYIHTFADAVGIMYVLRRMFMFFIVGGIITRPLFLDPYIAGAFKYGFVKENAGFDVLFGVPADSFLDPLRTLADAEHTKRIEFIKTACQNVFNVGENKPYDVYSTKKLAITVGNGMRALTLSAIYLDASAGYELWTKILQPITPGSFLNKTTGTNNVDYKYFIRRGLGLCVLMRLEKVRDINNMDLGFAALSGILKYILTNLIRLKYVSSHNIQIPDM